MTHKYTVKSIGRIHDILLLTLAPKNDRNRVRFTPGQYATIGFDRCGRPTPMRSFSIVSTPSSGVLQFAMRVRGNFTQAAAQLQVGENVRVQGPFGEFTLDSEYDKQVVMLAGGIGITPFISILRDMTERQQTIPVTLLFANRSTTHIPFYEELRALQQRNPYLNIRYFCGDAANSQASDIVRGSITAQHVQQLAQGNYVGSTYFICGPDKMTDSLQSALRNSRVHESRILSESFSQTTSLTIGSRFSIRSLTYSLSAATLVLATGFIMALDLSRTVPKLASAQTPAASSSNKTSATSTSTNSSASTSTNPSANSATTQSQPTQQTYNYQPPVSSVS